MRKKKFSAALAVFLCAAQLMTGCGASDTEKSSEAAAQESETSGESSSEDGSAGKSAEGEHEAITIMDAQRDYSGLIELVHEKYPEINIEVVPYRGRNMSAYCKQQLETGIMPDIYSTTQAWDGEYQEANLIDLSQYGVSELYNAARLEEYTVDGALYLLPFDFSITGILCNESLLERNGIAVPESFAELRDVTIPALTEKGIKVADCLLDLPGSAFNYFFNVNSSVFMNTLSGKEWRSEFSDTECETYAEGEEGLENSLTYFQEWIDCGMIVYDELSNDYTSLLNNFNEGNTAFLVGTIKSFSQNEDGTGDQYALMPYLSEDGSSNTYITSPTRFYGLNKELGEPGNEQKFEDAMHVLEVLSTNEGYLALNGEQSTNMCSIADFSISEDSPYAEAVSKVSKGYAMNLVYTGWDDYLVPFGEAVTSWIKGESTKEAALSTLDETKKKLKDEGTTYYATVTEELDTVEAAQLSGQMFMEATGADAALISYNVYSPEVPALMENSYGANGHILPGNMSEEYITIFLPTGWYDTLVTVEKTGLEIKTMAAEGCDTRGTGYHYPYVFMTADGEELADDETYTVVLCGYNKDEKDTLGLVDTGIVGLDAAKDYLLKVGEVSKATLDESLLQTVS